MANPRRSKTNNALGIKVQTAPGSVATLAATDYLDVVDLTIEPMIEDIPINTQRFGLDQLPSLKGTRQAKVTASTYFRGGVLATASGNMAAYQGLSSVFTACSYTGSYIGLLGKVVFKQSGSAMPATISGHKDGQNFTFLDWSGSVKFSPFEAGKPQLIQFEGIGFYGAPIAGPIPTQTLNPAKPVQCVAAGLVVQGYAPVAAKFEVDLGVKMKEFPDINSTNSSSGIGGYYVESYDPKGSIEMYAPVQSDFDPFAALIARTTGSVSAVIGQVAGSKMIVKGPCVQIDNASYGDANGRLTYQLPISFRSITGNDSTEISLE